MKNLFQIWIYVFGSPENNHEFITLCENVNIHICTTAAEAPWSSGLVDR